MIYVTIAAVALLVVAFVHLVAGWVLARGFRREILTVGGRPSDPGVWVRSVSNGQIILEAAEPRQDIGHPGTLGLAWVGGYGRLHDVIDVQGFQIIRAFQAIDGVPPVCHGALNECTPVEIDPFAFRSDPSELGLEFSETEYRSSLGDMGAWLVPSPGSSRWAIHAHGWTAEKRELLRILPTFHRAGFTSMVIDYRNDPGMPLDPSGHYRFGLTEWEDLEAAVRNALDQGADDIVLSGFSTGGAIVMSFLERSSLREKVRAIVLDSPNLILAEAVRRGTADSKFTPLMIEFGMWIVDLRWRIDWQATNFVQRAEEILNVPALVFHGTSDQTIPILVSRQLKARSPELVELVETPAAGHVMSWNADPERYEGYLLRFLERI